MLTSFQKAAVKVQAIQEGRQRSQLWWKERAIAMAKGGAGNTQIVMLGLRNRSRAATGWNNDSMKLEHSGPEGGPVQIEPTTVIEVLDARTACSIPVDLAGGQSARRKG